MNRRCGQTTRRMAEGGVGGGAVGATGDRAEWESRDRNLYGHCYTNTRAFIHTVGCAGTTASVSAHPPAGHDDHTCVPTTVHNTDCPAPHNFPSYTSHRQRGCAQVGKRGCCSHEKSLGGRGCGRRGRFSNIPCAGRDDPRRFFFVANVGRGSPCSA